MFERFTDDARKAMDLAEEEARKYNHDSVRGAHVLIGLLRTGHDSISYTSLTNNGVDLKHAREYLEKKMPRTDANIGADRLPLAEDCKRVVYSANEIARSFDHHYIRTEHLLLGLLAHEESVAYQVIKEVCKPEDIRDELKVLLGVN